MKPYEYRNAAFNEHGSIDMEINHPIYGWLPYTAVENDPNEMAALMFEVARSSVDSSTKKETA